MGVAVPSEFKIGQGGISPQYLPKSERAMSFAGCSFNVQSVQYSQKFRPGVLWGAELREVLEDAQANAYALPAVNVIGTNSMNAVLETARHMNSPVIIQFSNGGASFNAGKGLKLDNQENAILGSIAGAHHIHTMAKAYGVPVILHTDHCARKLLPWIDGLIDASESHLRAYGQPLFSSHMIDLSEEPLEQNVATCKLYLERMHNLGMFLEIELGVTGGEEDGVDNTDIDSSRLYTCLLYTSPSPRDLH